MSYIKQLQNNHSSLDNSIALIDCNNFYASCERIFNPKLMRRPIVVLSNNDGCIITRSAEAKKLGIKMGEPYFKAKKIIDRNNVCLLYTSPSPRDRTRSRMPSSA